MLSDKKSGRLAALGCCFGLYLSLCILGWPALLSAQDKTGSAEQQTINLNGQHGLKLTVPTKWVTRQKDFIFALDGTILEFQKGLGLAGVIGFQEIGPVKMDIKIFADAFIGGIKSASDSFEELNESKLNWGGVRRDCIGESDGTQIHYALCFFQNKSNVYFIGIWTPEDEWNTYKDSVTNVLNSVSFTAKPSDFEPSDEVLKNKKILDDTPIDEEPIILKDTDHNETAVDDDKKNNLFTEDETDKIGVGTGPGSKDEATYRSNLWKFEIKAPKDWTVTILEKDEDGKIASISDKNGSISGLIMFEDWEGDCDEYLDSVIDNVKTEFEIEVINESGGAKEGTLTYIATFDKNKYQYYSRVIDISGKKLRFTGWTKAKFYHKYQDALEKCAGTLKGW